MSLLLCIDTAGETAMAALCDIEKVIAFETNTDQKNHASFIQPAIQRLLKSAAISFHDIEAVSIVNGPGSYTGLRVGLATVKGICYALNKPLILLNTLTVMALAAVDDVNDEDLLYCPVIDARRNEVFTAVYNFNLDTLLSPKPVILEPDSFKLFLDNRKVVFFGSGHNKCRKIINHANAVFKDVFYSVKHVNQLSQEAFFKKQLADLAYAEPFYTKEFYSTG